MVLFYWAELYRLQFMRTKNFKNFGLFGEKQQSAEYSPTFEINETVFEMQERKRHFSKSDDEEEDGQEAHDVVQDGEWGSRICDPATFSINNIMLSVIPYPISFPLRT